MIELTIVLVLAGLGGTWAATVTASSDADDTATYPAAPLQLGFTPTSVFTTEGDFSLPDSLWLSGPGALALVKATPKGSFAVKRTLPLLPSVDPAGVAETRSLVFVPDRASGELLVIDPFRRQGPEIVHRAALGTQPSAIDANVLDEFTYGDVVVVAVANRASSDVSVFPVSADQRVGEERRVPVGAEPSAIAVQPLEWWGTVTDDFEQGTAVAVANRGSDSISIFVVESKGAIKRLPDVPVGRQPVALAWDDLNGDERLDLVVADDGSREVVALYGRRHGFRSGRPVALPAADRAGALSLEMMGGGVVVGDPAADTIWQLPVDAHGTIGTAVALRSTVSAAALATGAFGGDDQDDAAFIDPSSRTVEPLLQPGDRLMSPTRAARNLSAGDGRVMWSQRAAHDQRLMVSTGGPASELPVAGSRRPFRPRIGRARNGAQAATYVRCGRTHCRPYLWNFDRAREVRLRISVHRGCTVKDVARWRDMTAYVVGATNRARCPRSTRGLWVRGASRPARRTARADTLGDLRGSALTWIDSSVDGDVHLAIKGRTPRTIGWGNIDCCYLHNPIIRGDFVYWMNQGASSVPSALERVPLRTPTACSTQWPEDDDEPGLGYKAGAFFPDYSIDRGRVYYINDFGVFTVQPNRIHWTRAC